MRGCVLRAASACKERVRPLTRSECLAQVRTNEPNGLGGVPLGGAGEPAELPARPIDQQRGREADDVELARHSSGFVDVDAERFEVQLVVERLDDRYPLAVDGKRHDLEAFPAELGLEPIERRHLAPAGHAPCRPDVQEHELALEGGEGHGTPVAVDEPELGQRPRLLQGRKVRERPCGRWRLNGRRRHIEARPHSGPVEAEGQSTGSDCRETRDQRVFPEPCAHAQGWPQNALRDA